MRQNSASIGPNELIQDTAHEAGQMLRVILHHTRYQSRGDESVDYRDAAPTW